VTKITPEVVAQPIKNPDNTRKNEIRKNRQKLEKLEEDISAQEKKLSELEQSMLTHSEGGDYSKLLVLEKEADTCRKSIDSLQQTWETLVLEIEELEKIV
jgi:predicted  nucleic acid-binding Zn-ribbon protein